MIIETKAFKETCATILAATDNSEISTLTETLELKSENRILYLNVTNGEYFASVKFPMDHEEMFHATVNASRFLKLVAATTTESIELAVKDTYVLFKGNGTYKVPLITDENGLLVLPSINIANPTLDMKIGGNILQSILNYNSKELLRGTASRAVQKMFYMDEQGCITFTSGACVNSFTLEKPLKVLFNQRLVKLFKLFKDDLVDFTLGYDPLSDDLVQTKVRFETPTIVLTAITGCTDELLNSVPVGSIRGRANAVYPFNVVLNKNELQQAVNRLLIFLGGKNVKAYSPFEFKEDTLTIYDNSAKENSEIIKFKDNTVVSDEYSMVLDLADLKLVLDTVVEEYVTLSFGNHQAAVIKRGHVANVIPECRVS